MKQEVTHVPYAFEQMVETETEMYEDPSERGEERWEERGPQDRISKMSIDIESSWAPEKGAKPTNIKRNTRDAAE